MLRKPPNLWGEAASIPISLPPREIFSLSCWSRTNLPSTLERAITAIFQSSWLYKHPWKKKSLGKNYSEKCRNILENILSVPTFNVHQNQLKGFKTQIARTNPQCFWLGSGMSLKISFSNNFPGDTDVASQKYLRISVLCLLKRWHFVVLLVVVDSLSFGYAWKSETHISKLPTSIVIYSLNLICYVISQFSSVAQSLWPHRLHHTRPPCPSPTPKVYSTSIHWLGDAIQPSHLLLSPSPPAFNLSQHQGLFKWVSSSHQVAKGLVFQLQHQSFQWTLRTDLL